MANIFAAAAQHHQMKAEQEKSAAASAALYGYFFTIFTIFHAISMVF
jgi:hypothetical protein